MPATTLAIDIANYAGYLDPETIAAWQVAGVGLVIVRASTENDKLVGIARHQLRICRDYQMPIAAYGWLRFDGEFDGATQVGLFLSTTEGFDIQFLALDCEESELRSVAENIAVIREAVDACRAVGVESYIYSNAAWWTRADTVDNTSEFADVPLWDAHWQSSADLGGFKEYGGWRSRAALQYEGDTMLANKPVDLNIFVG